MRITYKNEEIFISTGGRDFDKSAPVLCFIHGSGQSHLTFLQQGRFFANRGWQVINADMPAHGHSAGQALTSIEDMADWYAGLLDELGIANAVIIGHSQGCLIGMVLTQKYPEKVSRLCLIAGAMAIPVNEDLLSLAKAKPQRAYQAMVSWAHASDSHLYDHSWPGMTHIDFGHQVMSANDSHALFADLSACNNYHDGEVAAQAVTCPTIAIIASKDKMTPAKAGRKMADMISDCELHEIMDAGHFLPSERPFDVNVKIRNFIS